MSLVPNTLCVYVGLNQLIVHINGASFLPRLSLWVIKTNVVDFLFVKFNVSFYISIVNYSYQVAVYKWWQIAKFCC